MSNFVIKTVYVVDILEHKAGHDPDARTDTILCRMLIPAHSALSANLEAESHMRNYYACWGSYPFMYVCVKGIAPQYMLD